LSSQVAQLVGCVLVTVREDISHEGGFRTPDVAAFAAGPVIAGPVEFVSRVNNTPLTSVDTGDQR
jgi:hypothetical protein